MKFLLDLSHPAVVHIYLPVIAELKKRGHEVEITSRKKDLTTDILDEAKLHHFELSCGKPGKLNMLFELIKRELGMLRVALKFKPDLIAGTSANAARVALYTGAKSLINNEDDAAMVPLFYWSAYPFATAIVTPDVLAFENHGKRHLTYPSFEKLFYLHPNRFRADPAIKEKLALNSPDGNYVIFRFSALKAHHDSGVKGLSSELIEKLIQYFSTRTNIWLSSERGIPENLMKYTFPLSKMEMHHALAQCSMLLCDSQSMSVEAGVLGVKSFRLNSFVGKLSVLNELDRRGLTEGFLPGQEEKYIARVQQYYANLNSETKTLREQFQKLMQDMIDPLPWFTDLLEALAAGKTAPKPR